MPEADGQQTEDHSLVQAAPELLDKSGIQVDEQKSDPETPGHGIFHLVLYEVPQNRSVQTGFADQLGDTLVQHIYKGDAQRQTCKRHCAAEAENAQGR